MAAQSKPAQLTPFGAALAGALGACFSNAVVYPLDVVKTRIQATQQKDRSQRLSVLPLLVRILREDGIAGYFKGFSATMLQTFTMQYAYFFFYSFVRGAYIRRLARRLPQGSKAPVLSTAAELLLGALAAALSQLCTLPISVIATRQQVGQRRPTPSSSSSAPGIISREPSTASNSSGRADKDESFLAVGRGIVAREGVAGLWLGLRPSLVLTVNPAITYGVYERVKAVLLPDGRALTPARAFAVGAFSKTLATIATYPYIMAKVRIQAQSSDDHDEQHENGGLPAPVQAKNAANVSAVPLLTRVWEEQGFLGWYQGMGAQILKAVLSQGVLFMSKDQFEKWALTIMALSYRAMRTA